MLHNSVIPSLQEANLYISKLEQLIFKRFGFRVRVGIELEFYLSDKIDTVLFSKLVGSLVVSERGSHQYEVVIPFTEDLFCLCKEFYNMKRSLNRCASLLGLHVDFRSKPYVSDYGSAAHYNLNLIDSKGYNVFANSDDQSVIYYVIAAILNLTNDSIYMLLDHDGFARLVPHFLAPTHISWGGNNRTTLVRLPDSTQANRRIEFRLPSPEVDPEYILLFLLIAVLEGLQHRKMPIPRTYGNAYESQYALKPLLNDRTQAKKSFRFWEIIGNYLN